MSDDIRDPAKPLQVPIKADDETQAGCYSNLARISHGAEAFQIDFLVIHSHPPFGRLQSRVILSPGHAKRFMRAMQENIERYEKLHGPIHVAEPPTTEGYLQ